MELPEQSWLQLLALEICLPAGLIALSQTFKIQVSSTFTFHDISKWFTHNIAIQTHVVYKEVLSESKLSMK